jgi:hypothetical protein
MIIAIILSVLGIVFLMLFLPIMINFSATKEVYGGVLPKDKLERLIENRQFTLNKEGNMIYSDGFYIVEFKREFPFFSPFQKYGVCSFAKNYGTIKRGSEGCKIVDSIFTELKGGGVKISNPVKNTGYLK